MYDELKSCSCCPKQCGIDRYKNPGACGADAFTAAAKAFLHRWEEPCISGEKGSGTIFFSGCNMKCVFCQNHEISQENHGKKITVERLSEIMLELQQQGAANINLVTPTPYVIHIIDAVARAKKQGLTISIIYNTNGYESLETLAMLKGTVDIYLPDIKYHSDEYALKYSGVKDYFKHATQAVSAMYEQVGYPEFDAAGLMRRGLLIRHLILPGLTEESKRIFEWIRKSIGKYAYVSIMCQYTPMHKAQSYVEINRKLSAAEYDEVLAHFFDTGLENGFMQQPESASSDFTPRFDLSGV